MKIGIGITTFNREECLHLFLEQLRKNPPQCEYDLHVVKNVPNIAKAKNECLFNLKHCDYIFLFDDDCFPKQPGWDIPFIFSGYGHLLYMDKSYNPVQVLDDVTRYQDCSGCFMFITKPIFEAIGYFNSEYGQYGYEHLAYSHRIKTLTKDWAFLCLNKTHKFIHSLDLDGGAGYKVHHEKIAETEKIRLTGANKAIYEQEISSEKLYYEYE